MAQLFGVCVLALSAAACSDDPRIPDGNHYPGLVVIDDMEDGQQNILSDSGRVGIWYIYSDETDGSTQEPAIGFPMWQNGLEPVPPRPCGPAAAPLTGARQYFNSETSCKYVARTWGTGQIGFGAGVGIDLNGEGGVKNPINASAFRGIGFFIRGSARNNTVRMNVQDIQTTPESAAAARRRGVAACGELAPLCDDPANAANPACTVAPVTCNAHYGIDITDLSANWAWKEFTFEQLAQAFGGNGSPIRRDAIVGIQFQVLGADGDANPTMGMLSPIIPFDFAIDNLSFLLP
ncbi:MAG: hypothetical protein ABW217_10130 [Polyangiaceae bacterium]